MHSKIIQIESAPIALSERISPDYYYDHWFLSSVADFVDVDEGMHERFVEVAAEGPAS